MLLRVFTLRFDVTDGGFDDGELRQFLRDKVVLSTREHFYCVGELPHLTLVVNYRMAAPSSGPASRLETSGSRRPRTDDLRDELAAERRPLFDLLRAWRSETASEEALPAYTILTNRQLLALAQAAPATAAALSEMPGLGRKRVARYGPAILGIINGRTDAPQADDADDR